MSNKKHIVIIGGGIGGLAAAALLGRDGYKVTVLEKNDMMGGRARVLKKDGFTFDMGPSWYMMPDVFDRFFKEFNKKTSDLLQLLPLDPQYRVLFHDGTQVDMHLDMKKNKAVFEKIEKGSAKKLDAYLAEAQLKYEISLKTVLYKNTNSLFDFFDWELIKNGAILKPFMSMEQYIKHFFASEKLQQIIEFTLVFLGGAPHNMPALYSLISYVDFKLHTFYPKGGMYAVIEALVQLGIDHGVEYVTHAEVTSLVVENGTIQKIHTQKKSYKPDVVIANADYAHVESLFTDQTHRKYSDAYWQKKTFAPSAFLMYLGIKGTLPQLAHHSIYYGSGWQKHFTEIFEHPAWPQDPAVYLNVPSMTDPQMAPKGCSGLMVLVPIASGLTETKLWKESYGDFIIKYLDAAMNLNISSRIVSRTIFSVSDFESAYNSMQGNALGGLAHTLMQTGPFRPPNKHEKINNLFFAGANTVPGIGVPPAIISGHLVRERVSDFFAAYSPKV